MSDFRKKCIGKAKLIGTFAAIPHPVAVEVTAQPGLDFICIDWEHAQIARDMIENLVRAADVHRVPAMVRVPGPWAGGDRRRAGQRRARRAGAARLDRRAGRARGEGARYPPLGERGVGPGRAAGYGYRIPEYLARANAEIVVAVQVETAEGLANVDAIAATDGVDVVFVGPGDLSVSIDAMGPAGADRLGRAIETIIGAALAHGRIAGIFCAKPEDARPMGRQGRQLLHPGQRHDVSRRRRRGRPALLPATACRTAQPPDRPRRQAVRRRGNFLSLKLWP